MSYQPRIAMPPLMVIGRTGAWGKMNRTAASFGRLSSGTIGAKS